MAPEMIFAFSVFVYFCLHLYLRTSQRLQWLLVLVGERSPPDKSRSGDLSLSLSLSAREMAVSK